MPRQANKTGLKPCDISDTLIGLFHSNPITIGPQQALYSDSTVQVNGGSVHDITLNGLDLPVNGGPVDSMTTNGLGVTEERHGGSIGGKCMVNVIGLCLRSVKWEVRDTALEFVAGLANLAKGILYDIMFN